MHDSGVKVRVRTYECLKKSDQERGSGIEEVE